MVGSPHSRLARSSMAFATVVSLSVLAGCPPEEVPVNEPPTAEITSHYDGQWVDEGFEITFVGELFDPDDDNDTLVGTWFQDDTEVCPATAPNTDGSIACKLETGLPPGESLITLIATDSGENSATAELTLTVQPTAAPTAEILSPQANDILYEDIEVILEGIVQDEEDSSRVLEVWWTSNLDGDLGVQPEADFTGRVAAAALLSPGAHELTLHAMDTTGKEGIAIAEITVGPPNTAPECEFVAPTNSPTMETDELLELSGTATDVDIPNTQLYVTWTSDLDGLLGASHPSLEGMVLFNTYPEAGDHTITMRAEDELGAYCEDSVSVFVNSPPIVQIAQPIPGAQFAAGVSVPFSGTIWDAQDDLSLLEVLWASNVQGTLHEGSPTAAGVTNFDASDLVLGNHLIKLTVTDTHGSIGEAYATITIF